MLFQTTSPGRFLGSFNLSFKMGDGSVVCAGPMDPKTNEMRVEGKIIGADAIAPAKLQINIDFDGPNCLLLVSTARSFRFPDGSVLPLRAADGGLLRFKDVSALEHYLKDSIQFKDGDGQPIPLRNSHYLELKREHTRRMTRQTRRPIPSVEGTPETSPDSGSPTIHEPPLAMKAQAPRLKLPPPPPLPEKRASASANATPSRLTGSMFKRTVLKPASDRAIGQRPAARTGDIDLESALRQKFSAAQTPSDGESSSDEWSDASHSD